MDPPDVDMRFAQIDTPGAKAESVSLDGEPY
jgi:hypothetical protein